MLREVIQSLPSAEFREGLIWHVGNVTEIDSVSLYFRLGRTSKSTLEIFDEKLRGFRDQEFETAPYTHVILDLELEVCAIAKKPRLAATARGIAGCLERLLKESPTAADFHASFEIDYIRDPADFITQLADAYSISKFWVTFSRPNAFDAQEDFVKPFQRMVEASNGEKGKAELKGKTLDAQKLEAVARSAAATGDDAAAWIKRTRTSKKVKKELRGNPVNIPADDVANQQQRRGLLEQIRRAYRKIRGRNDENEHR